MSTYLNLLPEQIGALWVLLDSEYLPGHPAHTLAMRLEKHSDFVDYGGDLLEGAIDLIVDKIRQQLTLGLTRLTGNVELSEEETSTLQEVLDELYPCGDPCDVLCECASMRDTINIDHELQLLEARES